MRWQGGRSSRHRSRASTSPWSTSCTSKVRHTGLRHHLPCGSKSKGNILMFPSSASGNMAAYTPIYHYRDTLASGGGASALDFLDLQAAAAGVATGAWRDIIREASPLGIGMALLMALLVLEPKPSPPAAAGADAEAEEGDRAGSGAGASTSGSPGWAASLKSRGVRALASSAKAAEGLVSRATELATRNRTFALATAASSLVDIGGW